MIRDLIAWCATLFLVAFVATSYAVALSGRPPLRPAMGGGDGPPPAALESAPVIEPGGILLAGPELAEPYGILRQGPTLWVADPHRNRGEGFVRAYDVAAGEEASGRRHEVSFPTGLAAWDGSVLVVDHGASNSVLLLGPEGEIASYGGSGRLDDPKDVAADRARDRVYVADRGNRRVVVLDGRLEYVASWAPPGDEFGPNGLAVGSGGRLFVADRDGPAVWVFSPEGEVVGKVGGAGPTEEGGMRLPGGVAVDPWGRLYVADYTRDVVQVFTEDGDYLGRLGPDDANDPSFGRPRGLAFDAVEGRLLVAGGDTLRNVARVWSLPLPTR